MINDKLAEQQAMTRERQLWILREDIDFPEYEQAHLVLFILHEAETNGWGTRWCIALRSAHDALRHKNLPRFEALLDRMQGIIAGKTENETNDEEN